MNKMQKCPRCINNKNDQLTQEQVKKTSTIEFVYPTPMFNSDKELTKDMLDRLHKTK